jgi:hypothetical protein
MSDVAQQVAEKLEGLPVEKQLEVLDFVEFLVKKLSGQSIYEKDQAKPVISFEEAIRKYSGCLEGGPADLSTNNAMTSWRWSVAIAC